MSEALSAPRSDEHAGSSWRTPERPDLRRGTWTRLGEDRVLGDEATEAVLGRLAERTRTAAQAEGYAVGWSAGQQAAFRRAQEQAAAAADESARRERARDAEHASAMAALHAAAAALAQVAGEVAERIGQQAADLAFEVTETLLGHELTAVADPGRAAVARAAAALPSGSSAVVRVHPQTARSVAAESLAESGVAVVADPTLEPHDAIVETDTTAVDLRISEAIARLREALS